MIAHVNETIAKTLQLNNKHIMIIYISWAISMRNAY